jgi:pimeloyl-ACP methyl ester carboxylesterase
VFCKKDGVWEHATAVLSADVECACGKANWLSKPGGRRGKNCWLLLVLSLWAEQAAVEEHAAYCINRDSKKSAASDPDPRVGCCTFLMSFPAGNFTASLNLYRANFNAQVMGNSTPVLPPYKLSMPVLAVHPEQDSYCLEAQIASSKDVVAEGCWQYKRVPGGHWFFVQQPDVLNKLLLDFLG